MASTVLLLRHPSPSKHTRDHRGIYLGRWRVLLLLPLLGIVNTLGCPRDVVISEMYNYIN